MKANRLQILAIAATCMMSMPVAAAKCSGNNHPTRYVINKEVAKAKCESPQYLRKYCKNCGKYLGNKFKGKAKLGHSWKKTGYDRVYDYYKCRRCGASKKTRKPWRIISPSGNGQTEMY